MSFLDAIDNIRGKSEGMKRSLTFLGSLIGTILIVILWLLIQGLPIREAKSSIKETAEQVAGPFSTIKDMSASIYKDVRDLSGLAKEKFGEFNAAKE